jgi:hypothetical protein
MAEHWASDRQSLIDGLQSFLNSSAAIASSMASSTTLDNKSQCLNLRDAMDGCMLGTRA